MRCANYIIYALSHSAGEPAAAARSVYVDARDSTHEPADHPCALEPELLEHTEHSRCLLRPTRDQQPARCLRIGEDRSHGTFDIRCQSHLLAAGLPVARR